MNQESSHFVFSGAFSDVINHFFSFMIASKFLHILGTLAR